MDVNNTGEITQFPHCDQRVLHAPGECRHCDIRAEWQQLRQAWGIAFSGHDPVELDLGWHVVKELPCPSEVARSRDSIQHWSGNVARPYHRAPEEDPPEPKKKWWQRR